MTNSVFTSSQISDEIKQAIGEMGFVDPSPIQEQAIPLLMEGRDVIGQAQTGTGKTAAFGIPALELIDPNEKSTQVLILCPTRELAVQVAGEIKKISAYKKGINSLAIYGGDPIDKQIRALKRTVHIVVGTPGRVIDHLERKTLSIKDLKMIILDEADEMLNMGFKEDIERILEWTPEERQTVLFSATMPRPIMQIAQEYMQDPQLVKVTKNELTVSGIEQYYYEVKNDLKLDLMTRLMDMHQLKLVLVFTNTKKKADEVKEQLSAGSYKVEVLHGDLNQNQRNKVMSMFRNGSINILVATDVAARGIDVDNVEAVFNYDVPLDSEYYVHRIGRTGRAGKTGKAFTFITAKEKQKLLDIQKYTKVLIERKKAPSAKELIELKRNNFSAQLKEILAEGHLNSYEEMINGLLEEGFSERQLVGALLKLHLGKEETLLQNVDLTDIDLSSSHTSKKGKMSRLFLNLGKKNKIRPGDIVGAIAGETGIPGESIGNIDIYDKFSFVEVPQQHAERVVKMMSNNQIKGLKVNMEIAKKP